MIGNASPPIASTNVLSLGGKDAEPTPSGTKYSGTLLGAAKQVPVDKPATFTIPTSGDPGIIFHDMGCTVAYSASADLLICPCHGSEFLVSNGDVIRGPSPRGLLKLDIVEEPDGNLYLK